jgi:hypothetical protein
MSSRVVVIARAFCAVAVAIGLPTAAAAQDPLPLPVEPPTRLEALMVRQGSVVICGSARVGAVRTEPGTLITVSSRELTDVRRGERALGIALEVRSLPGRDPDRVSYVDLEEVPSLLAAMDYMGKVERTATSLDRFEARYVTKGGLVVAVFDVGSGMSAAVASGVTGTATTELGFGEFQRLRQLVQVAYDALAALPAR